MVLHCKPSIWLLSPQVILFLCVSKSPYTLKIDIEKNLHMEHLIGQSGEQVSTAETVENQVQISLSRSLEQKIFS